MQPRRDLVGPWRRFLSCIVLFRVDHHVPNAEECSCPEAGSQYGPTHGGQHDEVLLRRLLGISKQPSCSRTHRINRKDRISINELEKERSQGRGVSINWPKSRPSRCGGWNYVMLQLIADPSLNVGKKAFIAGVADDQVQQPLPFCFLHDPASLHAMLLLTGIRMGHFKGSP